MIEDLESKLRELEVMSLTELRREWAKYFWDAHKSKNPDYIRRELAFHLQKRDLSEFLHQLYRKIYSLSKQENKDRSYISRIVNLSFLSPKIVKLIIDAKEPTKLTLKSLLHPLPLSWQEQEELFLS